MNNNCCPEQTPEKQTQPAAPCCPPKTQQSDCAPPLPASCCSPQSSASEIAGYTLYPFVSGWVESATGRVPQACSKLSWADRRGHWAMRWGIGRDRYSVTPGLYAVGKPDKSSPVLISANYKLSFDCLRAALNDEHAWILVIDTKGINVWCAAGKGTFGTDEIVRRCKQVRLNELVEHRQLIVPQLGAPGVAAFKVKQETGFAVIYGPVRATDLKSFLANGLTASDEMRSVSFTIWERLILTPVEIIILRKQILVAVLLLFILAGIGANIFSLSAAWHRGLAAVSAGLAGVFTGSVLTPILLPWLPSRAFAAKGALLGLITATTLALGPYRDAGISGIISLYLLILAIASYTAMNFTGSTTFTSPSGVEKEMRIAIPCQVLATFVAGLLWIGAAF